MGTGRVSRESYCSQLIGGISAYEGKHCKLAKDSLWIIATIDSDIRVILLQYEYQRLNLSFLEWIMH